MTSYSNLLTDQSIGITSVFCLHLSPMSVIENSCSKPSGFVNFQLALNLSPIMGDLVSCIDLASGQHWETGGNTGGNEMTIGQFTLAYS